MELARLKTAWTQSKLQADTEDVIDSVEYPRLTITKPVLLRGFRREARRRQVLSRDIDPSHSLGRVSKAKNGHTRSGPCSVQEKIRVFHAVDGWFEEYKGLCPICG